MSAHYDDGFVDYEDLLVPVPLDLTSGDTLRLLTEQAALAPTAQNPRHHPLLAMAGGGKPGLRHHQQLGTGRP